MPGTEEEVKDPSVATEEDAAKEPVSKEAETAEDSETSDHSDAENGEKPRKKGGFQRRLERIERERDHWRDEALRNAGKHETKQEAKPAKEEESEPEPKLKDFADPDEWATKHSAWIRKETTKEVLATLANQSKADREKTEAEKVNEAWQQKKEAAREKYDDFDEVLDVPLGVDIPRAMGEAIMTSDVGPDIAYFLGQNPGEAKRIAKLSPVAQSREIGRIEAYIAELDKESDSEEEEEKPPVETKAPPPPKPVKKSGPTDRGGLSDDLPMEEWVKRRNAQLKGK